LSLGADRWEVEKSLGLPLSDAQWEVLVDPDWLDSYRHAGHPDDLAEAFLALARRFGQRAGQAQKGTVPRSPHLDEYERAVAAVLAQEAAERRPVEDFRDEELGGQLLEEARLEEWMTARADEAKRLDQELTGKPFPRNPLFLLDYRLGGEDEVRSVWAGQGVLARLRKVTIWLADTYPWDAADGAAFLLCGRTPPVRAIEVAFAAPHPRYAAASARITLSVDPVLSPARVAEVYRATRRRVFRTRHRSLTVKHLRLARWALRKSDGVTWIQLMREWNADYPNWRQERPSNFARDCTQAMERLLNPPISASPGKRRRQAAGEEEESHKGWAE